MPATKNPDCRPNRILVLGLLGIFHIWDAFATIYSMKAGIASELNPLMRLMFAFGAEYFLATKAFLVLWGSVILGFAWEDHPGARRAAVAITTVYGILALYELAVLCLYWMTQ